MTTAVDLRDAGFARVIANAPHEYKALATAALDYLIASGEAFTADDVRALVPTDVPPAHPNFLPALMGARAARGVIVPLGRYRTTRRSRHSSKNQVWRGVR